MGKTLRDGSPIPRTGKWLKYDGPIKICESGLHASRKPSDAVKYAPGVNLCLVECRGIVAEQSDKFVCAERRIIVRDDMTEMLRWYARQSALAVVDLYPNGGDDAVFDFLMTGDAAANAATYATYAAANATYAAAYAAANAAVYAANVAYAANAATYAATYAAVYAANVAYAAAFDELVAECFKDWL